MAYLNPFGTSTNVLTHLAHTVSDSVGRFCAFDAVHSFLCREQRTSGACSISSEANTFYINQIRTIRPVELIARDTVISRARDDSMLSR